MLYNLIGEKVDARVTKNLVEVYYHGSRVASHRRLQTLQRDCEAQNTFMKNALDDANQRVALLESDWDALIAILRTNNIAIPQEIRKRYNTDGELRLPLE